MHLVLVRPESEHVKSIVGERVWREMLLLRRSVAVVVNPHLVVHGAPRQRPAFDTAAAIRLSVCCVCGRWTQINRPIWLLHSLITLGTRADPGWEGLGSLVHSRVDVRGSALWPRNVNVR